MSQSKTVDNAHNDAMLAITSMLDSHIPESDLDRREKLSINPINSDDYLNKDECSDVDQAIPPKDAGVPVHNGSTKYFDYSVLSKGYDSSIDWVIKGYIPQNSFGVIYGASESFKSFHAISWAASIASGREWNGARIRKSPVLYVAAEGGIGASRRAKGWEITYNENTQLDYLYAIKSPVFVGSADQVSAIVNTARLIERDTGEKVSVIFLDTLARCFGGADENKTADMNLFVSGCDKIKDETGASIVVVHHTGKNKEKDARGSSALRAACDFEYLIDRPDKDLFYILKCTKVKDSEPPKAEAFDMNTRLLFVDQDDDEVTTLVPSTEGREPPEPEEDKDIKLSANQEALLQAVRSRTATGENCTVAVVRDDLKGQGLNVNAFSKWLTAVVEKGLVRTEGDKLIPLNIG